MVYELYFNLQYGMIDYKKIELLIEQLILYLNMNAI